jgi:hypothetical protein
MAIEKITENFRYSINEETYTLLVWNKKDENIFPFLEQSFNPYTGETFTSVEDAETFFSSQYGEMPITE